MKLNYLLPIWQHIVSMSTKLSRVQKDPDPAGSLINWPPGSITLPANLSRMVSCDDGFRWLCARTFQDWNIYCLLTVFRIRIQHFTLKTNPDTDPGFRWPKIGKNLQWNKNFIFFLSKIVIYLSEEVFSLQKRTSSNSEHEISSLFSIFVGQFCPPGSGSGSTDLIESGSGIEVLVKHAPNERSTM